MNEEYKIKGWVARDSDDCDMHNLTLGFCKPKRAEPYFWIFDGACLFIPEDMFPELTWEDSPIEVELTIKKI